MCKGGVCVFYTLSHMTQANKGDVHDIMQCWLALLTAANMQSVAKGTYVIHIDWQRRAVVSKPCQFSLPQQLKLQLILQQAPWTEQESHTGTWLQVQTSLCTSARSACLKQKIQSKAQKRQQQPWQRGSSVQGHWLSLSTPIERPLKRNRGDCSPICRAKPMLCEPTKNMLTRSPRIAAPTKDMWQGEQGPSLSRWISCVRESTSGTCFPCSLMMGAVSKGAPASWHSIQPAAAMPKTLGVVPNTGMVRTRKFGTTWKDENQAPGILCWNSACTCNCGQLNGHLDLTLLPNCTNLSLPCAWSRLQICKSRL